MGAMKRELALAEQIADIYLGDPDAAPRVSFPSEWDRAFITATHVALEYAVEILTDKAETDCDNAERYWKTVVLCGERMNYLSAHGIPFQGWNGEDPLNDEDVAVEIDNFQVWLMENSPEVQAVIQQTSDDIMALAAEKGVTLDEAIKLWNAA